MSHPRRHEQTEEFLSVSQCCDVVVPVTDERDDLFVVVDRSKGRDVGITPPVIDDELAAAVTERPEVRVRGVERIADLLERKGEVFVVVE